MMGLARSVIEDLLRRGQAVRFVAAGGSMAPTIRDGDEVVVAPTAPEALGRGDIALYAVGPRLLAHRIVGDWTDARGVRWFCLRGDNLERCDPPVPASAVLGRVVQPVGRW